MSSGNVYDEQASGDWAIRVNGAEKVAFCSVT